MAHSLNIAPMGSSASSLSSELVCWPLPSAGWGCHGFLNDKEQDTRPSSLTTFPAHVCTGPGQTAVSWDGTAQPHPVGGEVVLSDHTGQGEGPAEAEQTSPPSWLVCHPGLLSACSLAVVSRTLLDSQPSPSPSLMEAGICLAWGSVLSCQVELGVNCSSAIYIIAWAQRASP